MVLHITLGGIHRMYRHLSYSGANTLEQPGTVDDITEMPGMHEGDYRQSPSITPVAIRLTACSLH
jgi:hypothetical protein